MRYVRRFPCRYKPISCVYDGHARLTEYKLLGIAYIPAMTFSHPSSHCGSLNSASSVGRSFAKPSSQVSTACTCLLPLLLLARL